jgi:hypothetical protein
MWPWRSRLLPRCTVLICVKIKRKTLNVTMVFRHLLQSLYANTLTVLCRVEVWRCVTYKAGFGLDDWIYWHLIHSTRNKRQYSAIADLHTSQFVTHTHTLGFSVFTSRILATDSLQFHCHFKSHMKSSFRSLIPFLPLFCSCQFRRLDSIHLLPSSYPGRLASRNSTLHSSTAIFCWTLPYNHFAQITQETQHVLLTRRVYRAVA